MSNFWETGLEALLLFFFTLLRNGYLFFLLIQCKASISQSASYVIGYIGESTMKVAGDFDTIETVWDLKF